MHPWDSETKHTARQYATHDVAAGAPAETALFLPAGNLYDVKESLRVGLITPETFCIFFEHDAAVRRVIRRKMRRLDWVVEPLLVPERLELTDLRPYLEGRKLDYAFVDFCDSLDGRKASWLHQELAPRMRQGGSVAITLNRCTRRNRFMSRFRELSAKSPSILHRAARQLRESLFGGAGDIAYSPAAVERTWHHRNTIDVRDGEVVAPVFRDGSIKLWAATAMAWARRARLDTAYEYSNSEGANGSRMSMFRFIHGVGERADCPRRLQRERASLLTDYFPKTMSASYG